MRKTLDDLLCERYPLIFAERNLSMQESCMYWGFACDDGWFTLIDTLCAKLQAHTDLNGAPQVVATQVKEKYGELRFYVQAADKYQHGMIAFATAMSAQLCEKCGHPGKRFNRNGWLMTRCEKHASRESDSVDEPPQP